MGDESELGWWGTRSGAWCLAEVAIWNEYAYHEVHTPLLLWQENICGFYGTSWFLRCVRASIRRCCLSPNRVHQWQYPSCTCLVEDEGCAHQKAHHPASGAVWSSASCSASTSCTTRSWHPPEPVLRMDWQHYRATLACGKSKVLQDLRWQQGLQHCGTPWTWILASCEWHGQPGRLCFQGFISIWAHWPQPLVGGPWLAQTPFLTLAWSITGSWISINSRGGEGSLSCSASTVSRATHSIWSILQFFSFEESYCLDHAIYQELSYKGELWVTLECSGVAESRGLLVDARTKTTLHERDNIHQERPSTPQIKPPDPSTTPS